MSTSQATTAQSLLTQIAEALVSVGEAAASAGNITVLLAALGWEPPPGIDLVSAISLDATSVASALANVVNLTASDADAGALAAAYVTLAKDVADLIQAADKLTQGFPSVMAAAGNYVTATQIEAEFVPRLLDLVVASQISQASSPIFAFLNWLGIIEFQHFPADHSVYQVDHDRAMVHYDRIPTLVTRPMQLFEQEYGWNTASFDADSFIGKLCALLAACWLPARLVTAPTVLLGILAGQPADPAVQYTQALLGITGGVPDASFEAGVAILPVAATAAGTDAGIGVVPYLSGAAALSLSPMDGLTLTLNTSLDLESGAGLVIRPTGTAFLGNLFGSGGPTVQASGVVGIEADYQPTASPMTMLSVDGGCVILCQKVTGTVGATVGAQGTDFSLGLAVAGSLQIGTHSADGFLGTMLPADGSATQFNFGVEWSQLSGFHFTGAPSGKFVLPLHQSLGPLWIDSLTLAVAGSNGSLQVVATVTAGFQLGPVSGLVQDLGVSAALTPRPDHHGNLGPVDVTGGFQPPDGIALGLDAAPVSGVGFIAFDEADARYLGAIALQVGDVAISAIGVLDTKVPGGGYSLIVVASAQFPPVQLGFGFSLSAIGGLVGVNRTADVPTLQALARAGRLDDLMFPADLIHRAPQVAANLAQQFPVAQGHFIVGPAVQIQWGTGGLVYADIGVFIELTDSGGGVTVLRIALLGLVHLTLPEGAAPVADITLDVLGVLDFAAQTLSLDAGLRNSTIATFPLTGQAALRAGWGSNPEFLFAVGGFNPCFQAPTGFPALQRVALSIGGDNPRLRLSAYLALTSNTLQLGCAADLYASVQAVGVTAAVAASLTFDALVQFKPFGLRVDLTISAAILINDNPILAMSLDLHVTGPNPWTVTGSASFQFLFATITIPVSIPGGTPAAPQPATPVDLDGNLLTALADPRSWATGPPTGRSLVRVRSQGTADTAVHPLGSLTVRQRAVPLGQRIECYGPDPLKPPCRYDITGTDLGTESVAGTAVSDYFAPAQFRLMNDQDKLSSPSFESMTAGATLGTADLSLAPIPVPRQPPPPVVDSVSTMDWDYLTLDSPDPAPPAAAQAAPAAAAPPVAAASGSTSVPDQLLAAQLGGAAAARSGPAGRPEVIYASPGIGIAVQDPYYAITGLDLGVPASTDLPSLTAGLTAAAQAGYQRDWQIVCTSEVG